jgi:hypothetical protein
MDRRKFIKGASAAGLQAIGFSAVAVGVGWGCASPKKVIETSRDLGPEPLPPTRNYPVMPAAVVGMAGVSGSIEAADAVDYYYIYWSSAEQVIAGYREVNGAAPMFGNPYWFAGIEPGIFLEEGDT